MFLLIVDEFMTFCLIDVWWPLPLLLRSSFFPLGHIVISSNLLVVVVEFPQLALDNLELLLCLCDDGLEVLEADLIVGLVACARLILVCAVVLDLFAALLDLCHAECCTATLEEVAEGAELGKVLLLTVCGNSSQLWFFLLFVRRH